MVKNLQESGPRALARVEQGPARNSNVVVRSFIRPIRTENSVELYEQREQKGVWSQFFLGYYDTATEMILAADHIFIGRATEANKKMAAICQGPLV
jgi:hypothetical protein